MRKQDAWGPRASFRAMKGLGFGLGREIVLYLYRSLLLALILAAAGPGRAQLLEAPPAPLWRLEANGDAVQGSLDLALPRRWKGFERTGFTSTRPDGGSTAVHYRSADGLLKMRILVQLRGDVRGVTLPGADGLERNWRFIQMAADLEFSDAGGTAEDLADNRFVWGDARAPNARMQLRRYRLPAGNQIRGIWYRNIGLWAVMIAISGPEDRRADIEATGKSALTEIQWPGAPVSAELHAVAPEFLRNLRDCGNLDRNGNGQVVDAGPEISSMIALGLYSYFVEGAGVIPHPAVDGRPYCHIESFKVGRHEVVALGWTGDVAGYPAARYAFMLKNSGILFQFESFFTLDGVPAQQSRGIRRLVWLTVSGSSKVSLLHVLTDWPSYEQAKAIVLAVDREGAKYLVEITHPPGKIHAIVNQRGPPSAESPAQPPANKR